MSNTLDTMAKGIIDQKQKAAKLTPLAGEVAALSPIPNRPGIGTLEHDPDIILGRLADARREIESVLVSIVKLQEMWGAPSDALEAIAAVDTKLLEKEKERQADDKAKAATGDKAAAKRVAEADPVEQVEASLAQKKAALLAAMTKAEEEPEGEAFADRLKRLEEEAKAATFKAEDAPEPAAAGGWACPTHGKAVSAVSPRRGVTYNRCPEAGCAEFEKL